MKKILILFLFIFLPTNTTLGADIDLSKFTKNKEYSNFYSVNEEKKVGILMKNGEYLIIPTDEKVEVIKYMDCCPIVEFRKKFYYVDQNFNVYEVFNFRGGDLFYVLKKDNKYGLLNYRGEGNIVLPAEYDYMEILKPCWVSHDGITDEYHIMMWVKIRKEAWYGYYDCATNKLSEFKYKDLRVVKKGKFHKMKDNVHYYLQKKTSLGWQYIGGKFYKEIPKRLWEDTVMYYLFLGCVWDSLP